MKHRTFAQKKRRLISKLELGSSRDLDQWISESASSSEETAMLLGEWKRARREGNDRRG